MSKEKTYAVAMILAMAGLYFCSFFQRVAIPGTIFSDLQNEFSISAAEATRLSAIYLFIYAAMQPFAGLLADRFGGVKIALVSGMMMCAGSIAFPLSSNLAGLYFSRAVVGFGASAVFLCLMKEADLFFSGRNFAPIVGILSLLGCSGGLVGTRPFRMMVEGMGWRNSCMMIGVFSCVILAFAGLMARKVKRRDKIVNNNHIVARLLEVLGKKRNYPIFVPWAICFAIYFSIQATIGAKLLEDLCRITPLQSSNYTFIMMLVTMTTLFSSGLISRCLGNKRKIFLLFASVSTLIATAIFLLGSSTGMPPCFFLPGYLLLAIACGISPVVVSMMAESNENQVAIAIGLLNTAVYVMVAFFSQLIGSVLDIFKTAINFTEKSTVYPPTAYIAIFGILLVFALAAVISSCYSRETYVEKF